MRKPDVLAKDGFTTDDVQRSPLGIALLSLRTGLKAYFSSYRSLRYNISLFDPANTDDRATLDFNHFTPYWEAYSECIVHLHHFFELLVKELLRREHPLLAVDTSGKHEVVYKLAKRKASRSLNRQN